MPVRFLPISFGVVSLLTGALGGCGGTTAATPLDAGAADATVVDAAIDTGAVNPRDAGALDSDAACSSDVDLIGTPIPDASLGDGGLSTTTCVACARTVCGAELAACQAECECRRDIAALFVCAARDAGSRSECVALIVNSTSQNAQPFGLCAITRCAAACAPGTETSSDASSD